MSSDFEPKTISNTRSTRRESFEAFRTVTTSIVFAAGALAVEGSSAVANKTRAGLVHAAETAKQHLDSVRLRLETVVMDHDSLNTLGNNNGMIFDEPSQEQVIYASDSGFPPGHVTSGDLL